ncbi:MAG: hypothetical protein HY986_13440 [Candidatus Melainabacteria bacterium]|nr:hypothetical protein [Candidatus Melainabacteria bacterium]
MNTTEISSGNIYSLRGIMLSLLAKKLEEAFRGLEEEQILTAEDYNLSLSRLPEEATPSRMQGTKEPSTKIQLHVNSEETFLKDGCLFISFNAKSRVATRSLGQRICKALKENGIEADWSGAPEEDITVAGVTSAQASGSHLPHNQIN